MNMPAVISAFSSNNEMLCGSVDFGSFFLEKEKWKFFFGNVSIGTFCTKILVKMTNFFKMTRIYVQKVTTI